MTNRSLLSAGDLARFLMMWTIYLFHHVVVLPVIFLCCANQEARASVKRILCHKAKMNTIGPADCTVEPRPESQFQMRPTTDGVVSGRETEANVSTAVTEVEQDFSTESIVS